MRHFLPVLLIVVAMIIAACAADYKPSPKVERARDPQAGYALGSDNTPRELSTGNYRELSTLRLASYPDSLSGRPASNAGPDRGGAGSADGGRRGDAFGAPMAFDSTKTEPSTDRPPAESTSGVVLGEGDVIEFRMFGQPSMTTTGYVSAKGTVSLPLLKQVEVGGLTPSQVESKVAAAYRAGGYFMNPQVNINIARYRSQQISVLGEVNKPGRYPLETRTSVLDAVAQAEGLTQKGASTVTVIRRTADGVRRYDVSLEDLFNNKANAPQFTLTAGDTLFVPAAPLFYIYGEVRRPAAYAIRPGMMVMQAISMGGGLTERGSNSRIVIHREENGEMHSFMPSLNDTIRPDDVIFVKERFF